MTGVFDCTRPDERGNGLDAAAAAVRAGDLVVLPTDTVYGVAADAFSPTAIKALLQAKGRGRDMPVPVLVSSQQMLSGLVQTLSWQADALTERFWPGALSIVVAHPPHLNWDLGDTKGTAMLRMPNNEIALDLIAKTGPLATSSANRSGNPPATTMLDARLQLGAMVEVYLDGGPCSDSVPSTIIDVTGEHPRLLRAGALDVNEIRKVVSDLIVPGEDLDDDAAGDAVDDAAGDDPRKTGAKDGGG